MTFSLTTRLIAEFLGTAIMVMIGNGSVANVELKGTKGNPQWMDRHCNRLWYGRYDSSSYDW